MLPIPSYFIDIITHLMSNSSLLVADILSAVKYSLLIFIDLGDFKLCFFDTAFTLALSIIYQSLIYLQ